MYLMMSRAAKFRSPFGIDLALIQASSCCRCSSDKTSSFPAFLLPFFSFRLPVFSFLISGSRENSGAGDESKRSAGNEKESKQKRNNSNLCQTRRRNLPLNAANAFVTAPGTGFRFCAAFSYALLSPELHCHSKRHGWLASLLASWPFQKASACASSLAEASRLPTVFSPLLGAMRPRPRRGTLWNTCLEVQCRVRTVAGRVRGRKKTGEKKGNSHRLHTSTPQAARDNHDTDSTRKQVLSR